MRSLVTVPNKVLRQQGRVLDCKADELFIRDLRREMTKIMKHHGGIGLTAQQVGEAVNFFVIDPNKLQGVKKFNYFINPEIELLGEPQEMLEACLSIPGEVYQVKRHIRVRATAQIINGEQHTRVFHGLTAQCIQQEYDHTKGILIDEIGIRIKTK